ncbi:nucleotide sugar dehydrogenase [Terrimonas pollutisoli]|uniref:nucleotide sugar dehydrogenase n=1 Tax=Terrimonas pollutisoli TaxID=3034147 RepID=UPI0023ED863D|nr:nucleotide sugar dehydrogenase [Terrimonas sp. H1YJ31]
MKTIAVIGFGKIGQAIAANILQHHIRVIAIDVNMELLEAFQQNSYGTKEPGLKDILVAAYKRENLIISHDYSFIKGSDCIIITIPLLIDEWQKIQDGPFLEAIGRIAIYAEQKVPIIIETSVPVGFTRQNVLPVIESKGKKHGRDFLLAHSPERIKSGTMMEQLTKVPKVIAGVDQEATDGAYNAYLHFFDKALLQKVETVESAEMLKLAGMIYRDVNIALSNQLAGFANSAGIDFVKLLPLINTDGEANLLQPGIGVGGHCTPVYPYFLIDNFSRAGLDFTLAKQSRLINNGMADYAVSLVKEKVKNKKALILGLGFRPNVKEDALSTTYLLHETLIRDGFEVWVHDTEFSPEEIKAKGLDAAVDIYSNNTEVVFLVTMHKEYGEINFVQLSKSGTKFFVDGRNAVDRKEVEVAGILYFGIGH